MNREVHLGSQGQQAPARNGQSLSLGERLSRDGRLSSVPCHCGPWCLLLPSPEARYKFRSSAPLRVGVPTKTSPSWGSPSPGRRARPCPPSVCLGLCGQSHAVPSSCGSARAPEPGCHLQTGAQSRPLSAARLLLLSVGPEAHACQATSRSGGRGSLLLDGSPEGSPGPAGQASGGRCPAHS